MKTIYNLLFFTMILSFMSCQKQDIKPERSTLVTDSVNTNPIGYNWELYSGRVFVTNLDNGDKFYYDHFGPNKNSSNLDIYSSSWLPFDILTKGVTNWKFTSSNQFIIDNGSTYNYNVNINGIFNIYGLENGSQRNVEILKSTENYIDVKVYESFGNDGIYNYSFYSVLTFVKLGFTGTPILTNVPNNYVYNGILGNNNTTNTTLVGTKWVVSKFIQNFTSIYPNDTLEFISNTQYTINNSNPKNYSLSTIIGNSGMKSLSLYSFTTLGGDWSGQVQNSFISDWVINNSNFSNILGNNTDVKLWMVRIQ